MDISRKPGWYGQAELQPGQKRYWDGHQWTDRVANTGGRSIAWQIVLAALIIGAVAFGVLNIAAQFARTN